MSCMARIISDASKSIMRASIVDMSNTTHGNPVLDLRIFIDSKRLDVVMPEESQTHPA
jgi:hypothetical protein